MHGSLWTSSPIRQARLANIFGVLSLAIRLFLAVRLRVGREGRYIARKKIIETNTRRLRPYILSLVSSVFDFLYVLPEFQAFCRSPRHARLLCLASPWCRSFGIQGKGKLSDTIISFGCVGGCTICRIIHRRNLLRNQSTMCRVW